MKWFFKSALETVRSMLQAEIKQRDILKQLRFINHTDEPDDNLVNMSLDLTRKLMSAGVSWYDLPDIKIEAMKNNKIYLRIDR